MASVELNEADSAMGQFGREVRSRLPLSVANVHDLWESPENREQICGLLLDMCRHWALADMDDRKWEYLGQYVFPLHMVWREPDMFEQMQELAHQGEARKTIEITQQVKRVLDCDSGRKLANL